ncbi:uncharacterized protein LOC133034261 [Cannabis sativa]|uniref:uncharacterized protein LOC133034261 n=1 Tax=Cannabis sativa TaxID=3483 RepID=UPI0029C9D06F|nr:uncharacterized protein LOC133034261 [Cannabis sativa]
MESSIPSPDPTPSTVTASPPDVTAQSPASSVHNPFSSSLSTSLTIKLDRANFLSWKSQVVPAVIGHDLDAILFNGVPPPQNLINGNPNPLYQQWKRHDQLLLSWLRSSMTEGVLASVANHHTSFAVWRALEQRFASQSRARLLQLKGQFSNVQKSNLSISDYVDKVQNLADSLAIAGANISDQDVVLQILNGTVPLI